MLNIFYGRENLDKEKFIFESVGDRALIMVPDQYTLEAERQAFRHLGVSSLMDVEIVSAASLGGNILSELGGNKRSFINKYGRHMLLYKSAVSLGDDLKVFRGMERKSSFLDSVNDFISEMKQYNCGPKDLLAMAESIGEDSYTGKKLTDIYSLFSEYEKQIEGRYTDSEDYIDLYLGKIKDSALIRDNTVWVYGFDSFAPKTMALLGQLMMYAKEVNIVLTWDDRGRDLDLFALTEVVMNNAEKLADSLGTAHIRQRIPDSFAQKEKAEAVRHIEKELYTLPSAVSNRHEGLIMTEAAGIYNEAESAAAYVLHLVRDKGLRYRDIRLIYNDLENRGDIIERVFEEYGIELFSDVKRDIMDSPIIKYITSLLDVVIEKYRTETLLSLLKSGFGDLSGEELSDLENYAVKYKIRGSMWKKPFRRGSAEYGEAGLSYINMLRQKAVDPIKPLEKIFEAETNGEFIRLFYDYLCGRMALRQKILAYAAEMLGCSAEELDIVEGNVVRKDNGAVEMDLSHLAMTAQYNPVHSEHITAESTATIRSNAYSFGCTFAEVEVDIPMCKVTLKRIINVHDCGSLINPALAEAQVHGGMSMGIGYGLSEQLLFDEKTGKPLNNNLLDYKLSTVMDHPDLEALFVENAEPTSPFGTKALGEPPACSPAPAIRNAILNATGVAFDACPITPHVLYRGFKEAGLIED